MMFSPTAGACVRRPLLRRRDAAAAAVQHPHEAAVHPSDDRCAAHACAYAWCRPVAAATGGQHSTCPPLCVPLELVPDHSVPAGRIALPAWLHARVGDAVRLDPAAVPATDVPNTAALADDAAVAPPQPRVHLIAKQPRDTLLSGNPTQVKARCAALRTKLHGLPVAPGCTVAARYGGVLHLFLVGNCVPGGGALSDGDPDTEVAKGDLWRGQRIMLPETKVLFCRGGERDDDSGGGGGGGGSGDGIRRAARVVPIATGATSNAAAAIASRFPTLPPRLAAVPAFADALREIQSLLREALRRDHNAAAADGSGRLRLVLPLPRGVLLTGFPGSGKSGLARHFCELARHDCAVHILNGSDLLSESERHAADGNTRTLLPTLDRILGSSRAAGIGRGSGGTVVVLDDLDVLAAITSNGGGGGFASSTGGRSAVSTERSARGHALRQVLAFCTAFCVGDSHHPPDGQGTPAGSLLVGITADAELLDVGVRSRLSHVVELPALNTQARADVSAAVVTHPLGSEDEAGGDDHMHARIAARTGGFVLRDMIKLHAHALAAAQAEADAAGGQGGGATGGGVASAALKVAWRHFDAALASVRPSRLDTLDTRVPSVTFADVGGYDDAKRRLNKAVTWQWSRGPAMRRLGVSRASGVLLHGPSGCGKTMLAEALAHECGSNFVAVRLQNVFSPYLGESERFVRYLFHTARRATPCMLFLDDLDAMAAKRDLSGGDNDGGGGGGNGGGVGGRILATLLNEMDGVESNAGVVVVAATNRKSAVDPALLRPGRLDVIVEIGMPTEADRASVLAAHTRRMPLADDVDLAAIATEYMTGGLSCAGLKAVCQTAALAAMRETAAPKLVEQRHFVSAVAEQRGAAATHGGGFVFHIGT